MVVIVVVRVHVFGRFGSKRVAAPIVGGLATSFALEILVCPAIYLPWRWHTEVRHAAAAAPGPRRPTHRRTRCPSHAPPPY
ncbi:MAG TPA: hypothetical protein VML54_09930 [Candidatus Limnocylindrales bacterium]|nr:hypothetical protein [Candidatus Limnocylindrales bacterium]